MRVRSMLVLCVALAVTVGVAPAAGRGGNSQNAKKCQKGGYKNWVRADQTPFKNVGQCVSYAAKGGTLTAPTVAEDRAYCAPAGPPTFGQCSVPGLLDFDFDASSGPLGGNPTGTFSWESLPFSFQGQVTCLQVTGNTASVGGTITDSSFPQYVGMGLAFTVVDNTPGTPDLITYPGSLGELLQPAGPAANTPSCGVVTQPTFAVTGDIVVVDN
jgi:hypothetical protein